MKRIFPALLLIACLGFAPAANAGVRIKDITDLDGARSNQLVGFGLVIGLDGTGSKGIFTQQVAVDMLQRFNVVARTIAEQRGDAVFKSGNISAVLVTAELGPFQRRGSKLNVTVSALDDATSLHGGELIMTPLKGADNVVYAVAQGQVLVGGYSFGAPTGATSPTAGAQKNHPTVGKIPRGGIIECEARGKIVCNGQIRLLIRDPDPRTSHSIATAINKHHPHSAITVDAGTVQVFVPEDKLANVVSFVGDIGVLEVDAETVARVIINARTGTVVAGEHVRISSVAVTHGNLVISTSNEPVASQPLPFSKGKTVVLPRARVNVTEEGGAVQVLEKTMSVAELARALNALGATPADLITIFQHLEEVGALHAQLIVTK